MCSIYAAVQFQVRTPALYTFLCFPFASILLSGQHDEAAQLCTTCAPLLQTDEDREVSSQMLTALTAAQQCFCEWHPAWFLTSCAVLSLLWRALLQTDEEKDMSSQMLAALDAAVLAHTFPKSNVDVYCLVLESGGSDLAVCISAACLALADGGIEMRDLISACRVVGLCSTSADNVKSQRTSSITLLQ